MQALTPETVRWSRLKSLLSRAKEGLLTRAPPWMLSAAAHMVLFIIVALIPYHVTIRSTTDSATFEAMQRDEVVETPLTRFEVGETPLDPSELTTETLMEWEPQPIVQTAQFNDDSPIFEERGGGVPGGSESGAGLGFDIKSAGLGPMLEGSGGVDTGLGTGQFAGRGGSGSGFGLRGSGNREAIAGVTKASERAVAAALNWIARHQNRDGSWSLDLGNRASCTDGTCTGTGGTSADAAATALAILPFLGAGQTHESKGPYQKNIARGINWLIQHQKPDGDLSGGQHQMYSHGLATLALCETYGMTQDSRVGHPAQAALQFIESGQNPLGGWRYKHGSSDGDTSVFGWQVMALKSGQMAHLEVDPAKFQQCKSWLQQVGSGYHGGKFSYLPGQGMRPSMTAVGLLAMEYLGAKRSDRAVREAVGVLMDHMPSREDPDVYYWYYATLAMHNIPGSEWEIWNKQIRKVLIDTQSKRGCAAGSWNPADDAWGAHGGRLMMTSLSALTLEVYYRYLPLYKLNESDIITAEEPTPKEEP